MYIAPNSAIRVLSNCPLDNTYDHTIYFLNKEQQTAYFSSITKYIFNNQTYQRVQRNKMRVARKADELYDCNYVMFQNTSYGNKWFYAFIVSVEYINNETSEITFEIDVMQTWHFDYTLGQCFVDREHSASDGLYGNTVDEDVNCGEDYIVEAKNEFDLSRMSVCILAASNTQGEHAQGRTVNGVYTALNVFAGIPATSASTLNQIISWYVDGNTEFDIPGGRENDIVAIFQYPSVFGDASTTTPYVGTKTVAENTRTINGYTPKNKKLFSYPYSAIKLSNNSGQSSVFKWELWGTGNAKFDIAGAFIPSPSAICYPSSYAGVANNFDYGLTINSFPQCAWVGDAFKQWFAQNRNSAVNSVISTTIAGATALGLAAANPATGVAVLASAAAVNSISASVGSSVARVKDLESTPPQVHGQAMSDGLNTGLGRVGYSFYSLQIKAEYARIIDEYFTAYGYATKRVKVPNRSVRPHWTFTRTIGCVVHGSVPADDMKKITDIYNNGITFWRNGAEIGDYSLDNSP